MTCQEAHNALTGRLETFGSQEPWNALEQHLEDCPDCERHLRETESIRRVLKECCARMRAPQALRSRIAGALPHRAA
jgi:mycothiol system anti-sigma-R factor